MTCHWGILAARRHAALVEALEECAPPVDNTYLGKALWRMKLPINVSFIPQEPAEFGEFRIVSKIKRRMHIDYVRHADQATAAYFDLVSHFSSAHSPHPCADAPTPLGAAAGAIPPVPAAPISDPVASTGGLPATATSLDARSDAAFRAFFSQASS